MQIATFNSPADWRGPEISQRRDWIHQLSEDQIAEIDSTLRGIKVRGIEIADIDKSNFPLPSMTGVFEQALEYLENGPGMYLLRGLPVHRLGVEEMRRVYWALSKHLGTAVAQSRKGDVVGDVRDLGINSDKLGRGYQNQLGQPFHTDSCDVVGLMVLRTAKAGGLSKIASSVALHNELLQIRPDVLETLYTPMDLYSSDRDDSCWKQPMFSVHEGHFCCKTVGLYARMAQQKFPDIPRLTPLQLESLKVIQEIADRPEFCFTMMFQPGDLQLLNSHVTLHGRTGFEDYEEPDRKRHLLRLWLAPPNSRPLSPLMGEFFRDARPGAVRGGYPPSSGRVVFESLVE
ncbi:MAG: TauD/TfdA family dioxygenase [Betaproteobacteria bacterium]|nr:TauD/TfdA family dioxygenase [Betaproteobacteria bacterium]